MRISGHGSHKVAILPLSPKGIHIQVYTYTYIFCPRVTEQLRRGSAVPAKARCLQRPEAHGLL